MASALEDLTGEIIAAAIDVHKALGPGFIASIYERALAIELTRRELPFHQQLEVPVDYAGQEVGRHRLDLLVADPVVVERKTVKHLEDVHFVVVRSYLKATRCEHGLLLNFSKPKLEIKRVAARTA